MALPPGPIPRDSASHWLACQGLWRPEDDEPVVQLPPQIDVALELLRTGHSEIQVRLELQKQYGNSARPNQAFTKALALLVEEEHRMQPLLAERVQAIRFRAIQGAVRDRQWGAVAKMLADAMPAGQEGPGEGIELAITIEQAAVAPEGLLEAADSELEAA